MHVATVRIDDTQPPAVHGDHLDVQFVPGDGDGMTIRLTTIASEIRAIPAIARPDGS
jgi:hypothetical protein